MPKKSYGGRWEILERIASGGQAEIFKIRDLKGEFTEQLALKRVRNPKRHDRFKSEVEAIQRLSHSNIIRLIDHSALCFTDDLPERQYIVMPFAEHGHLGRRASLYKENVDSVLQVANSLVAALSAAHDKGVIHRDLKPENILFPDVCHDVWLSDFGICLIQDRPRSTLVDEVVGPFQFMAPELEGGGMLDVTAAVDIYSLGKVIYYMISGGVVLPRERLLDGDYGKLFERGDRQRMLGTLLSRMICPVDRRLETMSDVAEHLRRIEEWEQRAHLSPMSPATLSRIEAMKRKSIEVQLKQESNADIARQREIACTAASEGTLNWISAELQKVGNEIRDGDGFSAGMRHRAEGNNDCPAPGSWRTGEAIELWIQNIYQTYQLEHVLRFSICRKWEFRVSSRMRDPAGGSIEIPHDEPTQVGLMLLPAYHSGPRGSETKREHWQFFAETGGLHRPENPSRVTGLSRSTARQPIRQPVQIRALQFSSDG